MAKGKSCHLMDMLAKLTDPRQGKRETTPLERTPRTFSRWIDVRA